MCYEIKLMKRTMELNHFKMYCALKNIYWKSATFK